MDIKIAIKKKWTKPSRLVLLILLCGAALYVAADWVIDHYVEREQGWKLVNGEIETMLDMELEPVAQEALLININTATASELGKLNGIGPSKAQAILDERRANGPFVKKEDIQRVKGIGSATYENIREHIIVEEMP